MCIYMYTYIYIYIERERERKREREKEREKERCVPDIYTCITCLSLGRLGLTAGWAQAVKVMRRDWLHQPQVHVTMRDDERHHQNL